MEDALSPCRPLPTRQPPHKDKHMTNTGSYDMWLVSLVPIWTSYLPGSKAARCEQTTPMALPVLGTLALMERVPLAPLIRTNEGADSTIRTSSLLLAVGNRYNCVRCR